MLTQTKNFYDFNANSLQERQERNKLFPELAKFHIALREELTEAEYFEFFNAEKESLKQFSITTEPQITLCTSV